MPDKSGPSRDGAALPLFSNQPTGDSAQYLHRVSHDVRRRLGKRLVDREDQHHKQQNGHASYERSVQDKSRFEAPADPEREQEHHDE